MKKALVFGVFLLFLAVGTASADTVSRVNSPVYTTAGITGFSTNGDMMVGMSVTAYFAAGGSETLAWAATGAGSGGVVGTGWSLSQSGDTFSNAWTLTASDFVNRVFIDAKPGQTVFDTITDPTLTPGSERGWAFDRQQPPEGTTPWDVNATYAGPLAITGDANSPYGDLYTTLNLAFVDVAGVSYGFQGTMTFLADTDNATTQIVQAPEPLSLILMGLGLFGLAGIRRRIRN